MATNYKDTLLLPSTDFPMKGDLVKREPLRLEQWNQSGLYQKIQDARKDAEPFILHDGPPFANGDVHMGTALNKTLKDIIVKFKTMAGYRAPFIPGWDCHGLPIEFKVVKESGKLSPLEIRKKSEAYARQFIDIQRRQFRRLGVLGDWENPYLTLDPGYEAEILRAFAKLVEKGLVYQSSKPVFWSTGAQTALAEAEIEYMDKTSQSVYVDFPLTTGAFAGQAAIVIWTTTPWTLPANLGIALHPRLTYSVREFSHPDSPATRKLILAEELVSTFTAKTGWTPTQETPETTFPGAELEHAEAKHPFLDRSSRVVLGDFVTLETGSGCVHIAPGHGEDDYRVGREYNLGLLSPVDDRGCLTEEAGVPALTGKYVFAANADVLEILKAEGRLLGAEEYQHSYPHCWRSKTPVIFRAVEQFFIRLDDLKADALATIDTIKWLPHWGRNRIYGTVESRPDWCISRQRTWGVPLPVFFAADGEPILDAELIRKVADLVAKRGTNVWFELDDATIAAELGLPEGTTRRNDTLDVWIDSGVSHQAVLRKNPALHFPADLYIEATDQHRGWFQSSLLTSVAIEGEAPYKTCLTHGFVVDVDGKKISKSSSYSKPMDAEHFVNKYGADILRLWVSSINFTDEVPFSEEMFVRLADTYRRLRNTIRILLANLHDFDPAKDSVAVDELPLLDRWALARLNQVITHCNEAYASYEFHKVYHALNGFCAVDLSSLYVDITKDRMYCDPANSKRRRATQTVMHQVLQSMIPLLAPITVFTADEAWEFLGHKDSVHLTRFPRPDATCDAPGTTELVDKLLELRGVIGQAVEKARKDDLIGNALEGKVTLTVKDESTLAWLQSHLDDAEEFFILSDLTVQSGDADSAEIARTERARCARCWRHRESVGSNEDHPELCDRCAEVVD